MSEEYRPKVAGKCGLNSGCDPKNHVYSTHETFSIGVFRWVPRSGKPPKKGAAIVRVVGPVTLRDAVFARANAVADEIERCDAEGKDYTGLKYIRVKGESASV